MSEREFFKEWLRLTVALKESEKGRLIDAIASFATVGKEEVLCGKEYAMFPVFCNLISEKRNIERTV